MKIEKIHLFIAAACLMALAFMLGLAFGVHQMEPLIKKSQHQVDEALGMMDVLEKHQSAIDQIVEANKLVQQSLDHHTAALNDHSAAIVNLTRGGEGLVSNQRKLMELFMRGGANASGEFVSPPDEGKTMRGRRLW